LSPGTAYALTLTPNPKEKKARPVTIQLNADGSCGVPGTKYIFNKDDNQKLMKREGMNNTLDLGKTQTGLEIKLNGTILGTVPGNVLAESSFSAGLARGQDKNKRSPRLALIRLIPQIER
jgi:hypothetical protein